MSARLKRLLLFGPLLAVGFSGLVGCLYIPTFNKMVEGKDASKQVGALDSEKPLRLHAATYADVVRVLGEPPFVSADGRRIGYSWQTLSGVWVTLCFGVQRDLGTRSLILTFDQEGILRTFEVMKRGGGFGFQAPSLRPRMPVDLKPRTAPPAPIAPGQYPIYRTEP